MESDYVSLIDFVSRLNETLAKNLLSLDHIVEEKSTERNNFCHPNCKVEKFLIFTFLESESKIYPQN